MTQRQPETIQPAQPIFDDARLKRIYSMIGNARRVVVLKQRQEGRALARKQWADYCRALETLKPEGDRTP